MVTRLQMADISTRYDTQVAAAFRRALGITGAVAPYKRKRKRRKRRRKQSEWRGMRECIRNERSPMDLRAL